MMPTVVHKTVISQNHNVRNNYETEDQCCITGSCVLKHAGSRDVTTYDLWGVPRVEVKIDN